MKSVLIYAAILAVAYFGADIVEKGHALNSLTPWPILGWALWVLTAFFIWHWLISPIIQFCLLERSDTSTDMGKAKAATRYLKSLPHPSNEEESVRVRLGNAIKLNDPKKIQDGLAQFHEIDSRRDAAKTLILSNCKAAGLAVIFSRNSMMDGILLLAIQAKMIVELARLAGYKPSPVFNTLCFSWILTNSILNAMFAQDAAQAGGTLAAETIVEMVSSPEELALDAVGTKTCSFAISALLEALIAGSTVYVTGHIFLRKLNLEAHEPGANKLDEITKLRRKGRIELGKELLKASWSLAKEAPKQLGKFTANTIASKLGFNSSSLGEADGKLEE